MAKPSTLNVFVLAMLITGAIDSIRNLPATALFGTALIFFFTFASVIFLIPTAFVSAELTATWSEKGGIYQWVRLAFGERAAFMAVWIQWISNVAWFPTILSFIAGTAAYLIDPALAQNKYFLVSIILATFWFLTIINLLGIQTSAAFASYCTLFGMIIPVALIILFAIIWLAIGHPMQIHFNASNIIPRFDNPDNWISLTAIMTAFLGMELATVHIRDVKNPQKTFPKALYISVLIILSTMMFGSLAIAMIMPKGEINLVNGVMQAFTTFCNAYHLNWFMPILTIMLLFGSLGGTVSWVISPVRGLLQAGKMGFFPEFLTKENKHGVATNLLLVQAVLVSIFCMAYLFMPSVNGSYWLLTALSTQMYIWVYVFMFITAIYLRYKYPNQPRAYSMPGGIAGVWGICLVGLLGCVITLIVGFIPPNGINVGNKVQYEIIFVSSMFAMVLPTLIFYFYKSRKSIVTATPELEQVSS